VLVVGLIGCAVIEVAVGVGGSSLEVVGDDRPGAVTAGVAGGVGGGPDGAVIGKFGFGTVVLVRTGGGTVEASWGRASGKNLSLVVSKFTEL